MDLRGLGLAGSFHEETARRAFAGERPSAGGERGDGGGICDTRDVLQATRCGRRARAEEASVQSMAGEGRVYG